MLRILSYHDAYWPRASALLATLVVSCSDPQEPLTAVYDPYYRGTWELTGVHDSTADMNVYSPPRSPTAEEARTWHVLGSENYRADTVRAPVTVEWGSSSGAGYWYFCCSSNVRVEVTLSRPGGGTELYVADLDWGGSDVAHTMLILNTGNHGYFEEYHKVGEP
jgi:hypothetical protein